MAANGQIRAFVANTKGLVNKAATLHQTSPVATAALGRALTVGSIMGLMSGNDKDSITINIKGDGPLGGVLVVSDGLGRVKGYANNPQADVPNRADGKLNVGGAIGAGNLTIAKDLGLKEPYIGTIELVSGEVAEDVASYFFTSEQTPSIVSLGVLVDRDLSVKQAAGFIIQLLPGCGDEVIDLLEGHISVLPPLTTLLEEEGQTIEEILALLLAPFGYEITKKSEIELHCNCSKDKMERALISLGKAEIDQIIQEQGVAELVCHFCNEVYTFTKEDLGKILEDI